MNKDLLNRFIDSNPKFNTDLNQLSNQSKEKFLRKLKKEKQEKNFLSIISEFRFCQFIESEGFECTYEPKIGGKTPDFRIRTRNEKTIYFDVKRFNTSDIDSNNNRKLHEFCEKLKSIKKPYYIQVKQVSDKIDSNIDVAFYKAREWIIDDTRKKDDFYILSPDFKIKIKKTDGINDSVLCTIIINKPRIHIKKPISDILDKVKTYQNEIINKEIPFFVAIDLTTDTLKNPFDYWLQFLGRSSMDISAGVESFRLGEFYNNKELNGLVGLLIRYNYEFYWINNPRNKTKIDFKNAKFKYKNNT